MSWNDDESCKFCEREGREQGGTCYTHCSGSETGKHVADPDTASNRESRRSNPFVFDVNCKLCGQSGSFTIEPNLDDITVWD